MLQLITWRSSLEEARIEAREQNKDLLIDIFDPASDGCLYMQENTYQDPRISRFLEGHLLPVRFNISQDPGVSRRFQTIWTPCIILRDVDDNEYKRSYGVLSPEQFLAEFSVANGVKLINAGLFDRAIEMLERARNYTAVDPLRNAENHYWLGIAKFYATNDHDELIYEWQKLRADHPSSDWARKTDFAFQ